MSKFEVIKIFGSRIEAELAKGYLGSMGIKTQVVSDDADQLYPSIGMVKGVKLITASKNLGEAKALLNEKEKSP
ncbi:MAG: hypothetical protein MUO59_07770 [Actinobacteria bacterium]|nr:hypothetical protein [Actinomycetota bacterium]